MIVLEGKPQKPFTATQTRVHDVLKVAGSPLSPLGLTRWVKQTTDADEASQEVVDAAESLWLGGYIQKYRDGSFGIE